MPKNQRTHDDSKVLTLGELIQERRGNRSYRDLEAACDGIVKAQRWEHMAKNIRVDGFPRPHTIAAIAEVLDVDVQAVILSTAMTLGMPVRRHGSLLATLLPPDADDLTLEQRNAVLAVVAAMNRVTTPTRAHLAPRGDEKQGTASGGSELGAERIWEAKSPDTEGR